MSLRARRDLENVFRLSRRCVQCEDASLSCEGLKCALGKVCVQTTQTCDACASVYCAIDPTAGPPATPQTNVGAIAGGVIGGVAFVAILVFVVWKFCLGGKRRPVTQTSWQEEDIVQQEKAQADFASRRSARASTHTVASMASSVLTRASNIIQIAYIPGVTNRSGPQSPDLLVPPVPPIPAMSPSSGLSSPYANSEQHFFLPDFRSSMASTSTGGRTSIAPSLAQRGSVASTMYRQNAIVSPLPAQTIVRGKAAVVSVKSAHSPMEYQGFETPPVPEIDPKHTLKPIRVAIPGVSPASSVRSIAQLGPVRALNIAKKKEVTPGGSPASADRTLVNSPENEFTPSMRPLTDYSIASSDDGVAHARARQAKSIDSDSDSDSDDDDHTRARQSLLQNSPSTRASDLPPRLELPTHHQSPFSDGPMLEPPRPPAMSQRITSYDTSASARTPMTPIVEEGAASKRASITSTSTSNRDQSPFADSNRSNL